MSTETNTQPEGSFTLEQWAESPIAVYDRYDEYMQHIEPLVSALHAECGKREFPMAFVVVHTQRADGSTAVACGMAVPDDLRMIPGDVLQVHAAASGDMHQAIGITLLEQHRREAHLATTTKTLAGLLDA